MRILKSVFIVITVILLSTKQSKAQIFFADKTIRGNTVVFKTITVSKDSFVVVDTDNELFAQTAKLKKFSAAGLKKRPAYAMNEAFTTVFSERRARELLGERALVVNYYVNRKGEIKEVTFTLRNISALTAPELEKLEFQILSKLTFIIPKNFANNEDLFIITQAVPYRSLSDYRSFPPE